MAADATSHPLLVACLGARDPASAAADARSLPPAVDLIEVRLDRFDAPFAVDLAALRRDLGRPSILTLRSAAEGGSCDADAAERAALLQRADAAGFEWIDLEADVVTRVPRGAARRILAWHSTGAGLDPAVAGPKVDELAELDADVVKVAAPFDDPNHALQFVSDATSSGRRRDVAVTAIAMGAAGRYLRPLAGRFGMPLLYSAAHASRRTAAGQITAVEAIEVYRAHRVTPTTAVYAVIGGDVARSLSPHVHNEVFTELGRDAVYVSIDAGDFDPAAAVATDLLAGASVTAPHKAAALRFARDADELARRCHVANTLTRRDDGTFHAANTDVAGFLAGLDLAMANPDDARAVTVGHSFAPLRRLDGERSLSAKKGRLRTALIYGTGGAAAAIAIGLRARGVAVTITGRDQGAATRLCLTLGGGIEAVSEGRAHSLKIDLLVKAVPDVEGQLPLDPFDFEGRGFAADVVYRPLDTDFLLASRRRGRTPIPGVLMFAEQAVQQAARFLRVAPDEVRPSVARALARELGVDGVA